MGSRLLWKILAVNVPLLVLVLALVWLTVDTLAASYFSELMTRYHISPDETHQMFLDAVHRYLVWTVAGALTLAVGLSFLLTRRMLRPLSEVAEMTGKVAAGDYKARVPVRGADEVAGLAEAFNRMADSLEQVESLRKSLVADVAHELRTPLTSVRGYLEALADGVLPPEKSTFDMLQNEVQRLVKLSDDLLELARADAARAYLRLEPVDLKALTGQALGLHEARFRDKGIAVHTKFAQEARSATADPDKLLQALGNLVENAWRYTPGGGSLDIQAEAVPEGVRLSFTNDAEPIEESDLPLLFERFYRPDKSRSRQQGGAGIGLSVVKELLEAHGGRVQASQTNGRLSIHLTLPR